MLVQIIGWAVTDLLVRCVEECRRGGGRRGADFRARLRAMGQWLLPLGGPAPPGPSHTNDNDNGFEYF